MIRCILSKKGWLIAALFCTAPALAQSIYIGSQVMMPSSHNPIFQFYTLGPQIGSMPRLGIIAQGALPLVRHQRASLVVIGGASRSGFTLIGDDRRLIMVESSVFAGAETRLMVNRRWNVVGGFVWEGVKVKSVLMLSPDGDRVAMRVYIRHPIRRFIGVDYQVNDHWRVQATYNQRRELGIFLADGQGVNVLVGLTL